MSERPLAVIKLGGSLLDWAELPARLRAFLHQWQSHRVLLVVGGGGSADVIRNLDAIHRWPAAIAHELAIRTLGITAHVLASLMPEVVVAEQLSDCQAVWDSRRYPALAPFSFLANDDLTPDPLEKSWDVTTDSIAARVADTARASVLVLLKSVAPPDVVDLDRAAALGFVDPAFSTVARRIEAILSVNLRDPDGARRVWKSSAST